MADDRPRTHVRLRYEGAARPSLILDAGSLNVLDLSERQAIPFHRTAHGTCHEIGKLNEPFLAAFYELHFAKSADGQPGILFSQIALERRLKLPR